MAGLKGGPARRRKRQRRTYKGTAGAATTMQEIKNRNAACGNSFFSKGAMRFFNSRIASKKPVVGQAFRCSYFVTSERFDSNSPRLYTVRKACGCKVGTVGDFQGHKTLRAAQAAAKRAAAKEK